SMSSSQSTENVPRNTSSSQSNGFQSRVPTEEEFALIEKTKVTTSLLDYIDKFKLPYMNDVSCYEKLLKIGQGTFGEVFKARCKKSGRMVALKKILMENEKEGFPITALREVKMLQQLKHQHITELIEICSSKSGNPQKERATFYLVFTFCEHDLAGLLSNKKVQLTMTHCKTLMKHLLSGLHQIHHSSILHRDMKAANVLITRDGVLKLADFGLARPIFKQRNHLYTNRVVTLWYRPPELLLGEREYGPAIDIWGAGCIMAELWTRAPILQGDTEHKQLQLISQLCGSIVPHVWPEVERLPLYRTMELPQNLNRIVTTRLGSIIKEQNAVNLIDRLLTLDPTKRGSAEEALDHTFFFTAPEPKEDVRDLMAGIHQSLFEYTQGRGAHAGRGRGGGQPHNGPVRAPNPPRQNNLANAGHYHDMVF
ncbi:cdk-9, partial [Pristionchus pacificus]